MLRIIKRRLHFWRFYWRRGGIRRFFVLKRWESFCCRYRHIKYGWTSPEFRRQRLFEMFHGCPMDFYFGEGPIVPDPIDWWYDPDEDESDDYEQWWEDYMPGRLIYYYCLLCRRLRMRMIDTEISERFERTKRDDEEYNARENKGRAIFDIMTEERKFNDEDRQHFSH